MQLLSDYITLFILIIFKGLVHPKMKIVIKGLVHPKMEIMY